MLSDALFQERRSSGQFVVNCLRSPLVIQRLYDLGEISQLRQGFKAVEHPVQISGERFGEYLFEIVLDLKVACELFPPYQTFYFEESRGLVDEIRKL